MKIAAIALNTWRETLRDRLLSAALICTAAMVLIVLGLEGNAHEQAASVLDLAVTLCGVLGALLAIFLGTSLVHKEMERRTLYIVLSKPITRFQFLAGKYLGLMATLAAVIAILSVGLGFLMLLVGHFDPAVFGLACALWMELALVTAMAFCFSCITSGILSALYTLGLYIVGQNVTLIRDFALSEARLNRFNYYGGNALYYVLPHFEVFDYKNLVLYGHHMPWPAWGWGLLYGAFMSLAFLAVGSLAWEGRELK